MLHKTGGVRGRRISCLCTIQAYHVPSSALDDSCSLNKQIGLRQPVGHSADDRRQTNGGPLRGHLLCIGSLRAGCCLLLLHDVVVQCHDGFVVPMPPQGPQCYRNGFGVLMYMPHDPSGGVGVFHRAKCRWRRFVRVSLTGAVCDRQSFEPAPGGTCYSRPAPTKGA